MIIEQQSDIIAKHEYSRINDLDVELLIFRDGKVLLLSEKDLALYTSIEAINDPLGNGLISHADMPNRDSNTILANTLVKEYKAGYVGLHDGKAILITPVAIQLFPSNKDALHNHNEIARLDLGF